MSVVDAFGELFGSAQQWLFEIAVQPLAFAIGAGNLLEDGFVATGWLLVGLLQIALLVMVVGPLQRLWPVEPVQDRHAIRIDIVYTLLHRLGVFKLAMFFTFEEWLQRGIGWLRAHGLPTLHIDQLWPGVTDRAWLSFLIYLLVFDFVGWLLHWAQHRFDWWWQLHAVHHSQRQMTMWSDNRNHLLDSVITDLILVVLAILIGVGPAQFVALVAVTQMFESLHHANLRWHWGRWGDRLLVSPRYHRRHHAVALGHAPDHVSLLTAGLPGEGALAQARARRFRYGANFGVLLPWWDMLAGTADFRRGYAATGIDDQVLLARDYGRGFWAQQWLGLRRLGAHLRYGLAAAPAAADERVADDLAATPLPGLGSR